MLNENKLKISISKTKMLQNTIRINHNRLVSCVFSRAVTSRGERRLCLDIFCMGEIWLKCNKKYIHLGDHYLRGEEAVVEKRGDRKESQG